MRVALTGVSGFLGSAIAISCILQHIIEQLLLRPGGH